MSGAPGEDEVGLVDLYQGTTSVVPYEALAVDGFSRCKMSAGAKAQSNGDLVRHV